MEFDFKGKHRKELVELYETGRSRKLRVSDAVVKKFIVCIGRIASADTIDDLREPPSAKFEKLQGYANRFSIRVTRIYRLEFEIESEDTTGSQGSVQIVALSRHYDA